MYLEKGLFVYKQTKQTKQQCREIITFRSILRKGEVIASKIEFASTCVITISFSKHDGIRGQIILFLGKKLLFFRPGRPHNWRQRLGLLNWNPIAKESHSLVSPHASFFLKKLPGFLFYFLLILFLAISQAKFCLSSLWARMPQRIHSLCRWSWGKEFFNMEIWNFYCWSILILTLSILMAVYGWI